MIYTKVYDEFFIERESNTDLAPYVRAGKILDPDNPENSRNVFVDGRTNTIQSHPVSYKIGQDWYLRYLDFLNELATVLPNDTASLTAAQRLIGIGFIPLGVSPTYTRLPVVQNVETALKGLDIPFLKLAPVSFITNNSVFLTEEDKSVRSRKGVMEDIWVHRNDFAGLGQMRNVAEVNVPAVLDYIGRRNPSVGYSGIDLWMEPGSK